MVIDVTEGTFVGTKATVIVGQPEDPTIVWNQPGSIVYGTPLSAAQLNASTAAAGTFSYDPPLGTVLTSGTSIM